MIGTQHGTHVAHALPDAEQIQWRTSRFGAYEREREQAWTCTCRRIQYTLIHAGGVAFIRKVEDEKSVWDSPPTRLPEGEGLWTRLVMGEAR
ncbi:hypothetical protein [Acrocarpospora sp. B8E8]|uniref:hypothetical protein n=1 Tax=Acrocarpospora sp. B8E8 TaxID=3153572 RepID=UPI00325D4245